MSMKISQLPDPTVTTSIVMIDETVNGTTTSVQYLNLGVDSSGKVRLLRCNASDRRRMNNVNVAHYQDCEADVWLNDESTGYLSLFDSATRNAMSSTSIKVKDENDNTIYEIARRCFLLSYTELGFDNTGAEGASILDVLKKWKNTTSANTARIAKNDSGSAIGAWLRSPSSAADFRLCYYYGGAGSYYASYSDVWLRPALSFDPETYVTDPDENNYCYLLPDPDKPYREAGIENFVLGTQTTIPTQAKIFLSAKGCMTNYPEVEITANFDDSTPVWLPVTLIAGTTDSDGYTSYTGLVDFSGVTASQGVKFAVNIYARTESQCRITQPVIAPA